MPWRSSTSDEYFGEYRRRKRAAEVVDRLVEQNRQILMAEASLAADPPNLLPVAYEVSHEIGLDETDPKLNDLVSRLEGCVQFQDRKVLYSWIGGTRRDWRGQGFFCALTEEQEAWALDNGFDEILVKTKNRFYDMRSTLDHLECNVIKFEATRPDNRDSKAYLSKRLGLEVVDRHRSTRSVMQAG